MSLASSADVTTSCASPCQASPRIEASSWTLEAVMTSYLQPGLTEWTSALMRVQESISTLPMASHQLRRWWAWTSIRSTCRPRRMSWTMLHQFFLWESDAWSKVAQWKRTLHDQLRRWQDQDGSPRSYPI